MTWTAIVPLKSAGHRKSRLSKRLDPAARERLSLFLFDHVTDILRRTDRISHIVLVCSTRPNGWKEGWRQDFGRGLNAELDAAIANVSDRKLIVHADLPVLSVRDIETLLDAAEVEGFAIAPDRHGSGTNALAIADDRRFFCCFGDGSFGLHRDGAGGKCAVVKTDGLALDCDTPEDLDIALLVVPEPNSWMATAILE